FFSSPGKQPSEERSSEKTAFSSARRASFRAWRMNRPPAGPADHQDFLASRTSRTSTQDRFSSASPNLDFHKGRLSPRIRPNPWKSSQISGLLAPPHYPGWTGRLKGACECEGAMAMGDRK